MNFDLSFALLHITEISAACLFFYVNKQRNKSQRHRIFQCNLGLVLLWVTSVTIQSYVRSWDPDFCEFFEAFACVGAAFIPVCLLFTGLVFGRSSMAITWKHLLLCIIPTISVVLFWTNGFHRLFYEKYSYIGGEVVYGRYFIVHALYSYLCVLIGLFFLLYYSIRNSGLFSKQALLIVLGFAIPVSVNVLFTFNILPLSNHATPIAFFFTVVCCFVATTRYGFLNLAPIALRSIVDHISDAFLVLNRDLYIIDYNKTLLDNFGSFYKIERYRTIQDVLKTNNAIHVNKDKLIERIREAGREKKTVTMEKHMLVGNYDRHFGIEITPILSNKKCMGTIILLKDVTQVKRIIEVISENQSALRKERHDFLNHLNTLVAVSLSKNPETLDRIENYAKKLVNSSNTGFKLYNTGNTYIDGLLAVKYNLCEQKGIHLDIDLDCSLAFAKVDDVDFASILGNILDNAIDALCAERQSSRDRKRVIAIYTYCKDEKFNISISNNGPRIPDKDMEKIFECRYSTKSGEEGVRGFGLFITKELVIKNQGRISVESTDSETEFLLEFYLREQYRHEILCERAVSK